MTKYAHRLLFPLILLSLSILFLQISAPRSFAQVTSIQTYNTINPSFLPDTNANVPQNLHTTVHGLILSVVSEGYCLIAGYDPLSPNNQCLGIDPTTKKIGYVKSGGGALGLLSFAINSTYDLPIHFTPYVRYLSENFHANGVTPMYADYTNLVGIGAQGLDPILNIWIALRNIAYMLIVIVFVVIGLGIMVRIKIDPRTVMSLQNQIPKIIIGLLLITFSYAISGLLIDFMYVLTLLLLNVLANAVGDSNIANMLFTSADPFSAVNNAFSITNHGNGNILDMAGTVSSTVTPAISPFISNIPVLGGILALLLSLIWLIPNLICTFVSWFSSNGCGAGFNGIDSTVNLLVFLAILVAVVVALFRFWMALVKAYISILFHVILSPLRILIGGLPGAPGGGFGGFIRDMLSNLLIFPVSLAYIFLAAEIAKLIGNSNNAFIVPLVPGLGIGAIVALCAIMMLPKIPEAVADAFKSKDVFGSAVGQAIAVGAGAASSGAKKFGARAFQRENMLQGQTEGFGRKLLMGWTPNNPWRKIAQKALGETDPHT